MNAAGCKFGIWFEPEMVSEDSVRICLSCMRVLYFSACMFTDAFVEKSTVALYVCIYCARLIALVRNLPRLTPTIRIYTFLLLTFISSLLSLSSLLSSTSVSLIQMLYTSHPDWCLHVPGRPRQLGRNQMVLDLSRVEVRNYLFQALSGILGTYV